MGRAVRGGGGGWGEKEWYLIIKFVCKSTSQARDD